MQGHIEVGEAMLKEERLEKIIEIVQQEKVVTVNYLSEKLNVTEMTIRRDLNELSDQHRIKRIHGGAKIWDDYYDRQDDIELNLGLHSLEKKQIAKVAAEIIKDKDVIFLGAGTTASYIVDYINAKDLIIVTNSHLVLEKLSNCKDCQVISTGGTYRKRTKSFIGTYAEKTVKEMRFTKCFVGTNGIDENKIYTSFSEAVILYKRVLDNSMERYIVTDHSKFNQIDFVPFYNVDELSAIITDDKIPEKTLKQYAKSINIINSNTINNNL